MKSNIILLLVGIVLLLGCHQHEADQSSTPHWNYEHPDWQNEGFPDCGGKVESPINIDPLTTVKAHLSNLTFIYTPFNFKIVNTGHTIQIINTNNTNKLIINNIAYNFTQLHFHHISEHTINGINTDMELHLVHQDSNNNLLVLSVMLKKGAPSSSIENIWAHIPPVIGQEIETSILLDLDKLIPVNKKYYTYKGSLTTPPCTAGVNWIIFKEPMPISQKQIEKFTKEYENNARPIQPLNNRIVLQEID